MLAKGLALFLNSTLVDLYFRQFNGHTQVNATDLRSLSYPDEEQLLRLGAGMKDELPSQDRIDDLVEEELFGHPYGEDPVKATKKVQDAMGALRALGFPRPQIDERSALTLLAFLDLTPKTPWAMARDPLIGISSIMDFAGNHYGRRYRPNTQQTLGRQTVERFLDAGLVVVNPDEPSRPAGGPDAVYQIEPGALSQLRWYGAVGSLAVESGPA
jgi:adenine-specific DNA-methyltransferase